jgi:hypothetical protein
MGSNSSAGKVRNRKDRDTHNVRFQMRCSVEGGTVLHANVWTATTQSFKNAQFDTLGTVPAMSNNLTSAS